MAVQSQYHIGGGLFHESPMFSGAPPPPPAAEVSCTNPRKRAREAIQNLALSSVAPRHQSDSNQHKLHLDRLLQAHGDNLRRSLSEKRTCHYRALKGLAEEFTRRRLTERDAELASACRLNAELEARSCQLLTELESWRAQVAAQEAVAVSLQGELERTMACVDDEESGCVGAEEFQGWGGPACRWCGSGRANVVLLPCRHLCVCRECDGVVLACPVCHSVSNSRIQVNIT